MPIIRLELNGDGAFSDLAGKIEEAKVVWLTGDFTIAALEGGMVSGKPSLCLRFDFPDGTGRVLIQETSVAVFLAAAKAIEARFGQ